MWASSSKNGVGAATETLEGAGLSSEGGVGAAKAAMKSKTRRYIVRCIIICAIAVKIIGNQQCIF